MKKYRIYCLSLILFITLLSGCSNDHFTEIDHHQQFVASMNILEPSLTFYNQSGDMIAEWVFEKAYSGAILIQHDRVLLYGHQLSEADIYELSTGEKIKTIKTEIGTTAAYFDKEKEKIFLSNSDSNTVRSYDNQGEFQHEIKLRNYPMSMISYDNKLYVINYKDTILSVVSLDNLQLLEEWNIEKSSHGMIVIPEKNELWIGGHGDGIKANQTVDVYDLKDGNLKEQLKMPLMPVGFAKSHETVAVVSHGENELYVANINGDILWEQKVGANPFAVAIFNENIVVAGYDDKSLYFLEDGKVKGKVSTGKGPFQLIVRED